MDEWPRMRLLPDCGYTVNESSEWSHEDATFDLAKCRLFATEGCPVCILYCVVIACFPDVSLAPQRRYSHGTIFHLYDFKLSGITVALARPNVVTEFLSSSISFYGRKITTYNIEGIPPYNTASTQSLHTVLRWIEECDRIHTCLGETSFKLPRRILDVSNDHVRLYETQRELSKYACLSHRWGAPDIMLCTTSKTRESFAEDIPWTLLPKTFQDAITFARRLGLSYLWIDSLCIIQDEQRDWEEQSGEMAGIYQNAYITLAATASEDASVGLHFTPDPSSSLGHKAVAMIELRDGTTTSVYARRLLDHNIGRLPLLQRGWVYQERILSPRMLHFARMELIWECNKKTECECDSRDSKKTRYARITFNPNRRAQDEWRVAVREYSKLNLTYPRDVFPALSGIVKAFARAYRDDYIAGLWRRSLVSDLLWYYSDSNARHQHPHGEQWRAPSWSWAACDYRPGVAFLSPGKEEAEVIDVLCQPAGADLTGELAAAHVTVRAKAISVHIQRRPDPNTYKMPVYTVLLHNKFAVLWSSLCTKSRDINGNSCGTTQHYGISDTRHQAMPEDLEVLALQLTSRTRDTLVNISSYHDRREFEVRTRSCLLIGRQKKGDARWMRVGIMTIADREPIRALHGNAVPKHDEETIFAYNRRILGSMSIEEGLNLIKKRRRPETRDLPSL